MQRKLFSAVVAVLFICLSTVAAFAAAESDKDDYRLTQMLVVSRHNLRAPFVDDDALREISTRDWQPKRAKRGELTAKGGLRETQMGQCFARYLDAENFLPANGIFAANEVRFYANSFERTVATAHYFAAGMMPAADVITEHALPFPGSDRVFLPGLSAASPREISQIVAELEQLVNLENIGKGTAAARKITGEVLNFSASPYAQKHKLQEIPVADFNVTVKNGSTKMTGALVKAMRAADALSLRYYEEPENQAAFGKKLTFEQWQQIGALKDLGIYSFYALPTMSKVMARPLLGVVREELNVPERKFTFLCGHDTNIATILSALRVKDFALPQTIEPAAPIGSKIVIEKRRGNDGKDYVGVSLVYMSSEDLRNGGTQAADINPVIYPLRFEGLTANSAGLYSFDDFAERINEVCGGK